MRLSRCRLDRALQQDAAGAGSGSSRAKCAEVPSTRARAQAPRQQRDQQADSPAALREGLSVTDYVQRQTHSPPFQTPAQRGLRLNTGQVARTMSPGSDNAGFR